MGKTIGLKINKPMQPGSGIDIVTEAGTHLSGFVEKVDADGGIRCSINFTPEAVDQLYVGNSISGNRDPWYVPPETAIKRLPMRGTKEADYADLSEADRKTLAKINDILIMDFWGRDAAMIEMLTSILGIVLVTRGEGVFLGLNEDQLRRGKLALVDYA